MKGRVNSCQLGSYFSFVCYNKIKKLGRDKYVSTLKTGYDDG